MWDFDDLEAREEAARAAASRSWALVRKPDSFVSPEAKDAFNSGDLEVDMFIWDSDVEIARAVAMFGIGVVALPTLAGTKGLNLDCASALDYEVCVAVCPDLPKDAVISKLQKCFGALAPAQVVEALESGKQDLEAKLAKLTLRELQKEVAQLYAWKRDVSSRLKTFERRAASAFLGLRRNLLAPCSATKLCHSAAEVAAAIRTAFRRKALELHPDKGGSAERFQVLQDLRRQVLQPLLQELDGSPCLDQAGSTDELERREQDDADDDRARQDGSSEPAEENIGVESAFKASPLQSDPNEWTSGPACDRQSLPDLTGEEAARLRSNFAMTRRHMCASFQQMWQQLRALAAEIIDSGEVGWETEDAASHDEKFNVVMQRLDLAINEGSSGRRESHNAFEVAKQNVRQIVGSIDATVDAFGAPALAESDPENDSGGQGEEGTAPPPLAASLETATLAAQPPHNCLASHGPAEEPTDLHSAVAFAHDEAACPENLSVDASTAAADGPPGDALAEGVQRLPGPTAQDLKWVVWNTMWCTANIAMSCVSHGEMKRTKLRAAAGDRLRRDKHRRSLHAKGTIDAEVVKGLVILANEAGLLAVQASHATTTSSSQEGGEDSQQRIDLSKHIAAAQPMSSLLAQGQWPLLVHALQTSAAAVREMLREFSPNLKQAIANHDEAWQLLSDDLLISDGEGMVGDMDSKATMSGTARPSTADSSSTAGSRSEATSDMGKTSCGRQPLTSLPQSLQQHLKWLLWNAAWAAANTAFAARDVAMAGILKTSAAENKQRCDKHLEGCKDTGLLTSKSLAKLKALAEACGAEVASPSWVANALAKLSAAKGAASKVGDTALEEHAGPDADPVRNTIWTLAGTKEDGCRNDFSEDLWKKLILALSYAAEAIGHMQLGAGPNSHGFGIVRGRWCQFLFDSTWNSMLPRPLKVSPREANAGLMPALTVSPASPTSPPSDAFMRHGFWGPLPGLSSEEVETCKGAFKSSMADIAAAAQSKAKGLRLVDYVDMFRNTHVHLPWVHTLAHHPRIVGLAQKVLQTNSLLLYSSQLLSWPGPGEGQRSGTRHDESTNLSVALGPVDDAVVICLALSPWDEAGGAPGYFHDYGVEGVEGPKTCISLEPGQLSAHKVGVPFLCGINRTKQRLEGIMLLYLSTNVRDLLVETSDNEPRDWAVLVSGKDAHGNFRLLRPPSEEDPGKILELRHLRLRRYGKHF